MPLKSGVVSVCRHETLGHAFTDNLKYDTNVTSHNNAVVACISIYISS